MNRLETLEQLARLCRTGTASAPAIEPSGVKELDAALPNGGWPVGTIIELMPMTVGIGEFKLLMPTLARLTRAGRHIALISSPYVPFAPALSQQGVQLERLLVINAPVQEDTLWAFEQTLRCKSFGAVIAWPSVIKDREVRRLQLAAEAGRSIGFLYRSPAAALESSPAAVRLKLQATSTSLQVDILKCRGARGGISVTVDSTGPAKKAPIPTLPLGTGEDRFRTPNLTIR
jgi:cell division inhibitor SulA/protein ImuA